MDEKDMLSTKANETFDLQLKCLSKDDQKVLSNYRGWVSSLISGFAFRITASLREELSSAEITITKLSREAQASEKNQRDLERKLKNGRAAGEQVLREIKIHFPVPPVPPPDRHIREGEIPRMMVSKSPCIEASDYHIGVKTGRQQAVIGATILLVFIIGLLLIASIIFNITITVDLLK